MNKLFFAGVPTEADVRKLDETFGQLREGDEITHEMVEECLGIERTASRYRSVTLAWRKEHLRQDNIEIGAVSSVGFRVLTPAERINGAVNGVQSGVRKQMRSIKRADHVRTDDPALSKKQELLHRYGVAIAMEANSMMREIEPPTVAPQMPRLVRKASS